MLSIFIILLAWPYTLLNMTHVINGMDPVNSLLLTLAITVFVIRHNIRNRKRINKKKALLLSTHLLKGDFSREDG